MAKNIYDYSLEELNRNNFPMIIKIYDYSRNDYSYGCTIISFKKQFTRSAFLYGAVVTGGLGLLLHGHREEFHYFFTKTGEELGSTKDEAINKADKIGEELMRQKKYEEANSYFNVAYHLCDDSREQGFKEKRDRAREESRKEKEEREAEARRNSEEKKSKEESQKGESEEVESAENESDEEESEEDSGEENEYEGREVKIERHQRGQDKRDREKRKENEQEAGSRKAKDIYFKAHRMWSEAFILENGNSVEKAKHKFQKSNKLFLKASKIVPNKVIYSHWFHISSLKLEGDSLFEEAISLQEEGNRLRQKQKYEQALIKYQEAQRKYAEGFNKSKDTRLKACIEFVDSCIKEVNEIIQDYDIQEKVQNIHVETRQNDVNAEENTEQDTILHQTIDS